MQIEHAGELIDEIVGLDQARFEPVDQIGCADALRDLGGRNAAYLLQSPIAACEIERDDDFSQIEDDGFDHFPPWYYQIPISFHHPKPMVDQMARLASDTTNPTFHHF